VLFDGIALHTAARSRRSAFIPVSERRPLPDLGSQRKKERTLEALIRQLERLTRQQPVVMIFEDAHWIDPTSREAARSYRRACLCC
jgi:predicted ATPase